jgi:dihydroxy-acid dehydratase
VTVQQSAFSGHVTGFCRPQRRRRGPLGWSATGDIVTIDLDRQVLDLEVPAAELERRRASFTPPAPSGKKGWLGVYERTVSPLSAGSTLRGLCHGGSRRPNGSG